MLSHLPPNRQSPASFDQVIRLPPKNASAPLGLPDAWWLDIPVPQVNHIRHMFTCQKSQRVGFFTVAILGGGWLQSSAWWRWLQLQPSCDFPQWRAGHNYSSSMPWLLAWPIYQHPWKENRKTSSISRTKSQNLNVCFILLQLSSLNQLKPCVKLRMKM